MKQVRLSKWNIKTMESLGFLTSDEINLYISSILSNDVHPCTPEKQKETESILPLLLRLVEAQESIAKNTSCVVPSHPLEKSSEKTKQSVQDIVKQQMITRNNYYRDEDQSIEEQYWWPKRPKERPLSEKQQQWIDDLFNKTMGWISSDWDWESSSGATRNLNIVYESLKWPADLYDQYVRMMQERILDNWEEKAELFKF